MNLLDNISELRALISDSEYITLVGHVNPDGDSIGSLIGMSEYLEGLGKVVMPIVPNPYPYFLGFLDTKQKIVIYNKSIEYAKKFIDRCDVVICMDFNGLKRIDELGEVIGRSKASKVLIDHHPQPEPIFDIMFSQTGLSSTCEVAYWVIRNLSPELKMNINGANALYTGMMTDTNNFANSVSASTFKMAGELLELGVDKEFIQKRVFGGFSGERMRLMGYMIYENMRVVEPYKAAIMVLTTDIKERFGFDDGDSEGFVNLALSIKDIEVSALFTQEENFVKVSLRSKGDFSVNKFARLYFNGGGHERAAGGKIFIPINDIEEYFTKSLKDFCGR